MGFLLFHLLFWVVCQSAESYLVSEPINCKQNITSINCPWNDTCQGSCLFTCADIPRMDNDPTRQVWGTSVYTYYSSICKAATHDLRISTWNKKDVTFILKRVPNNENYWASIRSGIRSYSYLGPPSPEHGSFIFLSPRVKENIMDVASIHEAFLFGETENHVQRCLAGDNSSSFSFNMFGAEPKSQSLNDEKEQWGNLTIYKMRWPELNSEAQTGGFQCNPENSTLSVVTSLAMSASADFYPSHMTTHVANVNESVTLFMKEHSQRSSSCEYTWKKDDEKLPDFINKSAQQRTSLLLPEVQEGSQGLYSLECLSDSSKRGLMRLIVRVCPKDKYGDNCTEECPDCKNGGVCHDITGVCICPPGFNGTTCENACPPGYFGQKCSIPCSQGRKPSCKGYLICLPDPYGCSCASGYKGLFCNDSCTRGEYGAGCTLIDCHCVDGKTCDTRFPICSSGCLRGWHGDMCNISYPVLTDEIILKESTSTSIRISFREWDSNLDIGNGTPSTYKVFYKKNNNGETWVSKDVIAISEKKRYEVTLQNLEPDTQYAFRVVILDVSGQTQEEGVKEYLFSTSCGTPFEPPLKVKISAEARKVFVSWELPPKEVWNCRTVKSIVKRNSLNVSEETLTTETSYSFTSKPFTKWDVTICFGHGSEDVNCTQKESVTTKQAAPGVVQDFAYTSVSPRSISLTWKNPLEKNGVIEFFNLQYRQIRWRHTCEVPVKKKIRTINVRHVYTTVEGLNPSAVYNFQITAFTVEEGPPKILNADTEPDVPSGSPRELVFSRLDGYLKWSPPSCNVSNGEIKQYWVSVEGLSNSDRYQRNGTTHRTSFWVPLLSSSKYEAKVFASTKTGFGNSFATTKFMTLPKDQRAPSSVKATDQTENSITITWKPSPYIRSNASYELSLRTLVSSSLGDSGNIPDYEWPLTGSTFYHRYKFLNLRPATAYLMTITTVSDISTRPRFSMIVKTRIPKPERPRKPAFLEKTEDTITIKIFPTESQDSMIRYYFVVVKKAEESDEETKVYDKLRENHFFAPSSCHVYSRRKEYVAARLEAIPPKGVDFTVGDGKCVEGYSNGPLTAGTYEVGIAVVSEYFDDKRYSEIAFTSERISVGKPEKADTYSIVLGVLVTLIIIICILIIIFVLPTSVLLKAQQTGRDLIARLPWRRREEQPPSVFAFDNRTLEDDSDDDYLETESIGEDISLVIAVKNLENYITTNLGNGVLKNQFKAIPRGHVHSSRTARLPENRMKNRYGNLLPYDHSRVKLKISSDGVFSDYINANYVCGYKNDKKYIATQGPLPRTVNDFWRMIWKENSCKIFMVTNLVEQGRVKCDKYWPDEDMLVGSLAVSLKNSEQLIDYVIRTFEICSRKEKRELKQYHYLTWPDHGAPSYTGPIIRLLKQARDYQPESEAPIIVHCSAGVGRTGTLILLDSMLEMGLAEGKVDVCGHLCEMRKKRINLLENMEQYLFVYKALEQAFCWGETSVPCSELVPQIGNLRTPDEVVHFTPLEVQYARLEKICPHLDNSSVRVARLPENVSKNRTMSILPPERARPILKETPGEGPIYINAVYVNGYKEKDAFLVTQYPLPDTVGHFWKMIYEKKSRTIVLLQDIDFTDATCPRYWPSEGQTVVHGEYHIQCISVKSYGDMRIWTLNLSFLHAKDNSDALPLPVKLFQNLSWPVGQHLPQSPKSILDLIDKVERAQREEKHIITVQCLNGSTACGVFCASVFVCNKMINEQEVDVFLAVQNVRMNRPKFIENFEQYDFLCDMALTFLDNFGAYANFL